MGTTWRSGATKDDIMSTGTVIDALRRIALTLGVVDPEAKIVIPIDSPLLLGTDLQAETLIIAAANIAVQVKAMDQYVQALAISAGPRLDGTSNVGVLFVGGSAATDAQSGFPLAPGAIINTGPINLSKVWFVGANVNDAIRILYVA